MASSGISIGGSILAGTGGSFYVAKDSKTSKLAVFGVSMIGLVVAINHLRNTSSQSESDTRVRRSLITVLAQKCQDSFTEFAAPLREECAKIGSGERSEIAAECLREIDTVQEVFSNRLEMFKRGEEAEDIDFSGHMTVITRCYLKLHPEIPMKVWEFTTLPSFLASATATVFFSEKGPLPNKYACHNARVSFLARGYLVATEIRKEWEARAAEPGQNVELAKRKIEKATSFQTLFLNKSRELETRGRWPCRWRRIKHLDTHLVCKELGMLYQNLHAPQQKASTFIPSKL